MKKLFNRSKPTLPAPRGSFMQVGFHGDKYLLGVTDQVLKNATAFFETGTNVGTTLAYVARTYPHLQCISCEPDSQAFIEAIQSTNHLPNVFIFNEDSQQFLKFMRPRFEPLMSGRPAFWLDAHGYGFEWPLREEVAFITSNFENGYILIDDFLVPGLPMFKYDYHDDQVCSYEYIKDSLHPNRNYDLYYPSYTDHTSPHHPLCGWGLVRFGENAPFEIPSSLMGKIRLEEKSK